MMETKKKELKKNEKIKRVPILYSSILFCPSVRNLLYMIDQTKFLSVVGTKKNVMCPYICA